MTRPSSPVCSCGHTSQHHGHSTVDTNDSCCECSCWGFVDPWTTDDIPYPTFPTVPKENASTSRRVDERPTLDTTLMDVARVMASRSTCTRGSVGVVVAQDGRIVSTGYNGAPAGLSHCDHTYERKFVDVGCSRSVHAEANAVAFAARAGVALNGSTLYTTMSPCLACAQLIVNSGVVHVVMGSMYRSDEGCALLNEAGLSYEIVM